MGMMDREVVLVFRLFRRPRSFLSGDPVSLGTVIGIEGSLPVLWIPDKVSSQGYR